MTRLEIRKLNFSYGSKNSDILRDVALTLAPNSFNLLYGPSGSGKSTLLKLMAGLYPNFSGDITQGDVYLLGQPVGPIVSFERAQHIAMLFQNPTRQFAMQTPRQQIEFALENLQLPRTEIQTRTENALLMLDLVPLAERQLFTMSGGEQQRVALAVIFALNAEIILLDEPFANVDPESRQQLLHIIKSLQTDHGKTIFISDHDLTGYAPLVDHVFQLREQRPVEVALTELTAPTVPPIVGTPAAQSQLHWRDLTLQVGETVLVHDSSFALPVGQLGLLSGANGSGKSTLFRVLSKQLSMSGEVTFAGKTMADYKLFDWAQVVGYVFQNASDQFITMTPREEFAQSRAHSHLADYWTDDRIKRAITALNLDHVLDHVVYQLSGGQQKKVQLLSVIISGHPVLLLDEPLAGLDSTSVRTLLTLLKDYIVTNQISALMISHQRQFLNEFVDYELHLANHRIALVTEAPHD